MGLWGYRDDDKQIRSGTLNEYVYVLDNEIIKDFISKLNEKLGLYGFYAEFSNNELVIKSLENKKVIPRIKSDVRKYRDKDHIFNYAISGEFQLPDGRLLVIDHSFVISRDISEQKGFCSIIDSSLENVIYECKTSGFDKQIEKGKQGLLSVSEWFKNSSVIEEAKNLLGVLKYSFNFTTDGSFELIDEFQKPLKVLKSEHICSNVPTESTICRKSFEDSFGQKITVTLSQGKIVDIDLIYNQSRSFGIRVSDEELNLEYRKKNTNNFPNSFYFEIPTKGTSTRYPDDIDYNPLVIGEIRKFNYLPLIYILLGNKIYVYNNKKSDKKKGNWFEQNYDCYTLSSFDETLSFARDQMNFLVSHNELFNELPDYVKSLILDYFDNFLEKMKKEFSSPSAIEERINAYISQAEAAGKSEIKSISEEYRGKVGDIRQRVKSFRETAMALNNKYYMDNED